MLLSAAALLAAAALQSEANALKAAGSETRSMMLMDLYELSVFDADGRLTEADLADESQAFRIEIEVLYGGDVPDIPEGWSSELKPVLPDGEWADLRAGYENLSEGDRVVLAYDPDQGTVIEKNGEEVVREPGFKLTANTLDIWFGDTPVSEDIKAAFLGD